MSEASAHKWAFVPRFRKNAFGWRSSPAIERVKEAVAEIRKVARTDPVLAASGAVLFLGKVSPALANVDSSSGSIGNAVNHAVDILATIIAAAPADDDTRDRWLEGLWEAYQDDHIPYIESLGDHWGALCASPARASAWADRFVGLVEMAWSPDPNLQGFFHGTVVCLSALFHAGRYDQLMELVAKAPGSLWHYRQWGVKALAATGRKAEAIRYAEASRGLNDYPVGIAQACEEILLSSGMGDEAYARYAIEANQRATFLATYRSIAKKYPLKAPATILADLVASTPGQEGKWFAAAKNAGLYDEAIALARSSPCDPRTLSRAARDFASTRPLFAVEAGIAALGWMAAGFGYDITNQEVLAVYGATLSAAANADVADQTRHHIRTLLADDRLPARDFVVHSLGVGYGMP